MTLRLGDWQARLSECTPGAVAPLQSFADWFRAFIDYASGPEEGLRHLVICCPPVLSEQRHPPWLLESDRPAWRSFHETWTAAYRQFCLARSSGNIQAVGSSDSFAFSWPRPEREDVDAFSMSVEREQPSRFLALVIEKPDEQSYLRIFGYSLFLATRWHVARGGLCLHSCAVARGRSGFLFLGASGAGKTTVAQLSAAVGYPPLGDDLNFVIRDGESGYLLAAAPSPILSPVGYSRLRPPLRAVFTLAKDESESLVPMSPMKTARALFDEFIRQTPYTRRLPDYLVGRAFQTACDIARRVPAYELHFRKSPGFWELIDEQFPD